MFDRLFERSAPVSVVCVDTVARLAEAEQRIRDLEALLQSNIIELDAFRAFKIDKPGKAKVEAKPRVVKPVKPTKIGALDFWTMHGRAVDCIRAEYGDAWRVAAPFGKTYPVTLTSCYRSAKTERGTKLTWPKDHRFPAAEYWPNGVFPDGVTIETDYSREDPGSPVEHDADWHLAHGYVSVGDVWVADMLARQRAAHNDAILAEREAKRIALLERAAMIYGPQPLSVMDLSEAAD